MTFQSNVAGHDGSEHMELRDRCPVCVSRRLVVAKASNWIFCPSDGPHACEWDMSYADYNREKVMPDAEIQIMAHYIREQLERQLGLLGKHVNAQVDWEKLLKEAKEDASLAE